MRVRHKRAGSSVDLPGLLPPISLYAGKQYLTTTAFLHFLYNDDEGFHKLESVTLFALPNGRLQDRYNPSTEDTFFVAGRNAPTLGEDFRVRVSFSRLQARAPWRVQKITYDDKNKQCSGTWVD